MIIVSVLFVVFMAYHVVAHREWKAERAMLINELMSQTAVEFQMRQRVTEPNVKKAQPNRPEPPPTPLGL